MKRLFILIILVSLHLCLFGSDKTKVRYDVKIKYFTCNSSGEEMTEFSPTEEIFCAVQIVNTYGRVIQYKRLKNNPDLFSSGYSDTESKAYPGNNDFPPNAFKDAVLKKNEKLYQIKKLVTNAPLNPGPYYIAYFCNFNFPDSLKIETNLKESFPTFKVTEAKAPAVTDIKKF